jgi:hypothetical protein
MTAKVTAKAIKLKILPGWIKKRIPFPRRTMRSTLDNILKNQPPIAEANKMIPGKMQKTTVAI